MDSWNVLRRIGQNRNLPWMVCEDFNEILFVSEKVSGNPRYARRMEAFKDVIDDCCLVDLGFLGPWFTWERGNFTETNIRERLGRGLTSE